MGDMAKKDIFNRLKSKNAIEFRIGEMASPKIDEWSIMGIATASSGKRQELDSELACPTP